MFTKKLHGEVRPASYLSPKERRKAVMLLKAIRSSNKVEEMLKYQIQLEELIEQANENKADISEHARALRKQDPATIKARLKITDRRKTQENKNNTGVGTGI